ncbi:MAG: acyl-ACP--UDP-N-acetylglucosamine O-acyltransferase [Gammaproteobacteria bacterium]|nr:acyl-ACP--UDP-N-acetylglucosamine O-acyltransferase [Gammaproteobacteria bacterium]
MSLIHPTALVASKAELATDVCIGPYTIVGERVSIGSGTKVGAHCVIEGNTQIGQNNEIYQFNSLGAKPQDLKYAGEYTQLIIGNHNIIREFCTFNLGTELGGGITRLGDHNLIMAYVHLAHDCQLANHIILANYCGLAGHVILEDWVVLGGNTSVFQRCTLGKHSFTGACTYVQADLPPFVSCTGNPAVARAVNKVGLKRRGFDQLRIDNLETAYRILYRQDLSLMDALKNLQHLQKNFPSDSELFVDLQELINFLHRTNGIVR